MPGANGNRRLKDHLAPLRAKGVDIVVSLLPLREAGYLDPLGKQRFARGTASSMFHFQSTKGLASHRKTEVAAGVAKLARAHDKGNALAVHRRAGIGGSSLVAACVRVTKRHSRRSSLRPDPVRPGV
jgi:hypothetical protein